MALTFVLSSVPLMSQAAIEADLTGTFIAVYPYGSSITNDLGVPYQLTVINTGNEAVQLDRLSIQFQTSFQGCAAEPESLDAFFGGKEGFYAHTDFDEGTLLHSIQIGALFNKPVQSKLLQPNESVVIDVLSSNKLDAGEVCLGLIEKSIHFNLQLEKKLRPQLSYSKYEISNHLIF